MNILAIGPHPDDIEIGCAGTLIKYAQRGHEVSLLIITKGEKGGNSHVRYEEQLKAAELMGVKDVFWGGFKDTELLDEGNDIAVDDAGNVYVTGYTSSTDFPTTANAIQPGNGGEENDFVT